MTAEHESYENAPYSALAHLGCAGLVVLCGICGTISLLTPALHIWLLAHPYTMPIFFLGTLIAAYLLEHRISTKTMLILLTISAICAGVALGSIFFITHSSLLWFVLSGPLGYFLTAAIILHFLQGRLYTWQLCSILTAGALLPPGLTYLLCVSDTYFLLAGLGIGLTTAIYELNILLGRSYFEITSGSRRRSTVIAMVMLITVPICQSIWYSLYYGRSLISRIFLRW